MADATRSSNNPTTASNQPVSGRCTNATEPGSNDTPNGNAPYSSRLGTPIQENSKTETKPMAL